MTAKVVIYNDPKTNYKEFRKVPHSLQPSDYDRGVLVGPPDLTTLSLEEDKALALNNALVDAGFSDFESLSGRRADLLRLVQIVLDLSLDEARQMKHDLLVLYTRDFYPEKFED